MAMKVRTVNLADEQKVVLKSDGHTVVEVEFSVSEQSCTVHFYGRGWAVANPIMLSVDTKLLGHTEDDGGE